MHHETTLNLPTLSSKDADRQWLAARLAGAGVVQVIESPIEPRPLASGQWTAADMTVITTARREEQSQKQARRSGRPHGTTADDTHLVERARAMADLGLLPLRRFTRPKHRLRSPRPHEPRQQHHLQESRIGASPCGSVTFWSTASPSK